MPSTHLLDDVRRLAGRGCLRAIDLLLALHILGGHVFRLDVARIARRDVHRDVLQQFLEVLGAGHKVALAVHFDQHADLAAGMDVGAHRALVGGAGGLLLCRGHAALAQHHECLFDVSLGLLQSLQAVAHGRAGLLAKLLHQLCINLFCHTSSRFLLVSPIRIRRTIAVDSAIAFRQANAWPRLAAPQVLPKEKRGNQTARPRLSQSAHHAQKD